MVEVVTLEVFGVRPRQVEVDALQAKVWEYLELKRQMEEIQRRMQALRKEIIEEVGVGKKNVGPYTVIVKAVEQERLRTRDVRRYLEQAGVIHRFVYKVETKRLEIV